MLRGAAALSDSDFLQLLLRSCEQEIFHGTLTQTSVHPREVVKGPLALNCAQPSEQCSAAQSIRSFTNRAMNQALQLVDVRVLGHFIAA